ncbi:MAG: hypothetical protein MN733_34490 [Nitrososphaera sp.]|nr:hypothetical protein [Nitrososphaera sp.]
MSANGLSIARARQAVGWSRAAYWRQVLNLYLFDDRDQVREIAHHRLNGHGEERPRFSVGSLRQ